jgi:hypothetical protein
MLTLGSLSFAAPWALLGLAALPGLWWLLRLTPPAPRRVRFPPLRFLIPLISRQEVAAKSPPWLLALRLLLAALVILAAAQPVLDAPRTIRGHGPLVLLADDGWAAATNWPARQVAWAGLLDQAARDGRKVVVVTTATADPLRSLPADQARRVLDTLQPSPWPTRRESALKRLIALRGDLGGPAHVVWLSDGLRQGDTARHLSTLRTLGPVTVVAERLGVRPLLLHPPKADGNALRVSAARPSALGGAASAWVRAVSADGRLLARRALSFPADGRRAEISLDLPAELRNRLARLEIEGERTAAGVFLLDERWRRRQVGLVATAEAGVATPFLDGLHYVKNAVAPFAEVWRGPLADLLERNPTLMVLIDREPVDETLRARIGKWIDDGGILLRFAGPRLAREDDDLLPVRLRGGERGMGGTMSWRKPATLAAFPKTSPFSGLEVPADVTISRQVLARPSLDLDGRTWARLGDGTPLVTGAGRGRGWSVLFHTTAGTTWSNLPLSGLFVDMLRRVLDLGRGTAGGMGERPLHARETLDAFGHLGSPPAATAAIDPRAFAEAKVAPGRPPGYYGYGTFRRAVNLSRGQADPRALGSLPMDVSRETYGGAREADLLPWILTAAALLAIIDLAVSLGLRGLLRVGAFAVALFLFHGGTVSAQTDDDAFARAASLETRLAYILTGNSEIDEISRAGLAGLSVIVNRRTAAELGEPVGIDPETDEMAFFPLLYWPMARQGPLSPRAVERLNGYLRNSGTILFDMRTDGSGNRFALPRNLARDLDIPLLAPIGPGHVLGRSYYLLRDFPGRWSGGTLWVERPGERINDGVSSVIVGSNDWAGAWAMDIHQRPLFAVVPGGERQRETAYRFGINLVMYVLTGNYKADQVHVPAILERLGR